MTRRAVPICAGFTFGIICAYPVLVSRRMGLSALGLLLLVSAALALFFGAVMKKHPREFFAFFMAAAVGALYLGGNVFLSERPVEELCGSEAVIRGRVRDISGGDSARLFVFGDIGGRKGGAAVYVNNFSCEIGDEVEMTAEIMPLRSSAVFDEKTSCLPDGIFVTAAAKEAEKLSLGGRLYDIRKYGLKVSDEIRAILPGERGELLAAMTTGDRTVLSDGLSRSLNRVGIGHIASVSGLHVSAAAFALWLAMRKLRLPKWLASAMVIAYAAGFAVFAGLKLSAVRAAAMVSAAAFGSAFRRRQDVLTTILITASLICLAAPYAVADVSFQLSFSGTLGVAAVAPAVINEFRVESPALRAFILSLCASVLSAPFILWHFNELSLIAPVMNIFFVPVLSAAIILGMAFSFTGCKFPFLCKLAGAIEAPVIRLCKLVSGADGVCLPSGAGHAAFAAVILVLGLAAFYFLSKSVRRTSVLACLAVSVFLFAGSALNALDSRIARLYAYNFSDERVIVLRKGGECVIIDYEGKSAEASEIISERFGAHPIAVVFLSGSEHAYAAYAENPEAPKSYFFADDASVILNCGWAGAELDKTGGKITLMGQDVPINSDGGLYLLKGSVVYGGRGDSFGMIGELSVGNGGIKFGFI